jgi:hypothetical protein
MSQIFVSYASEDRDRVQKMVDRLLQFTDSVFWDRNLRVGVKWRENIERELGSCKLVVVWSRNAIVSDWVKNEFAFCSARCPVLPVLIDDVEVPPPFDELQGFRLLGWPEKDDPRASAAFFDEVQQILVGDDFPTSPETRRFDLEAVKSSLLGIGYSDTAATWNADRVQPHISELASKIVLQIAKAQHFINNWKAIEKCLSVAEEHLSSLGDFIRTSFRGDAFRTSSEMVEKAKTQIQAFKSKHGPRQRKRSWFFW